jgi:hypothetical protein
MAAFEDRRLVQPFARGHSFLGFSKRSPHPRRWHRSCNLEAEKRSLRGNVMRRTTVFILSVLVLGVGVRADAQWRGDAGRDRNEAARLQGVPPGQMPPANQCRVWYDNRPPGRQPSATGCRQAEMIAARDRNARVVYGESAYWDARYGGRSGDYGRWGGYGGDGAVRRDGRVRDPRITGGTIDYGRDGYYGRDTPAYQNGYRDGLTKGREDGEDADRYDATRHSWYRSANRGYDDDYGTRTDYEMRYRQGFEAGYSEGYRIYARR